MNSIYRCFYEKQPISIHDILPKYDKGCFVTFLNPYSAEIAKDYLYLYEKADYICSDGIIPIIINKLCGKNNSKRISFDMTSLAPIVFDKLSEDCQSIYFVGTTSENMIAFVKNIITHYPKLKILGYRDGYINDEEKRIFISAIIKQNPSTIVIGMGTPLQDQLAYDLRREGYYGNIYTCGGFFHQTINGLTYYPKYIDRLNLRWLYRIIKEKYILKRILLYYPKFILQYFFYLIFAHNNRR